MKNASPSVGQGSRVGPCLCQLLAGCIVVCAIGRADGEVSAADPVQVVEFEKPGENVFETTDWKIPNSSGKGDKDLVGRAYVPSDQGHYPLIVMLPGFGASYQNYEQYSTHLASHGNVVLGVNFTGFTFTNPDGEHDKLLIQVTDALVFALEQFKDKIDERHIGVVGHSLGGKMAFYAAAALNGSDPALPRVSLAAGMDPVNSGGPPCFIAPKQCTKYPVAPNPRNGDNGVLDNIRGASLILRSRPDLLTNPDAQFNAYFFYYGADRQGLHGVPSPALYVDLDKASHASYALPYDAATNLVPLIVKRTLIAWIKTNFEQRSDLGEFLTGRRIQQDIDKGAIKSVDRR